MGEGYFGIPRQRYTIHCPSPPSLELLLQSLFAVYNGPRKRMIRQKPPSSPPPPIAKAGEERAGLIGFLILPLLPLPCLEDAADTVNITLVVISAVKEKEKTCLRMERERGKEGRKRNHYLFWSPPERSTYSAYGQISVFTKHVTFTPKMIQ